MYGHLSTTLTTSSISTLSITLSILSTKPSPSVSFKQTHIFEHSPITFEEQIVHLGHSQFNQHAFHSSTLIIRLQVAELSLQSITFNTTL
jgi:hypothetical protein